MVDRDLLPGVGPKNRPDPVPGCIRAQEAKQDAASSGLRRECASCFDRGNPNGRRQRRTLLGKGNSPKKSQKALELAVSKAFFDYSVSETLKHTA